MRVEGEGDLRFLDLVHVYGMSATGFRRVSWVQ